MKKKYKTVVVRDRVYQGYLLLLLVGGKVTCDNQGVSNAINVKWFLPYMLQLRKAILYCKSGKELLCCVSQSVPSH